MSNIYTLIEEKIKELEQETNNNIALNKEKREKILSERKNFINEFFNSIILEQFENTLTNIIINSQSVNDFNYMKMEFNFSKYNPKDLEKEALAYYDIYEKLSADNTCINIFGTTMTRELYEEIMLYIKEICTKYDLKSYSEASYVPTTDAKLFIYGEPKRIADMIYIERDIYQKQNNKRKIRKKVD